MPTAAERKAVRDVRLLSLWAQGEFNNDPIKKKEAEDLIHELGFQHDWDDPDVDRVFWWAEMVEDIQRSLGRDSEILNEEVELQSDILQTGYWENPRDQDMKQFKYKVMRYFHSGQTKVLARGLTREEAEARVQADEGQGWFDDYSEDRGDRDFGDEYDRLQENPSTNTLIVAGAALAAAAFLLWPKKAKAKTKEAPPAQSPAPFEPAAPVPVTPPSEPPAPTSPALGAKPWCSDPSVVLVDYKFAGAPPQYLTARSLARWSKTDLSPSLRESQEHMPTNWSNDQMFSEGQFGQELQHALDTSTKYFYSAELWLMSSVGWCLAATKKNF